VKNFRNSPSLNKEGVGGEVINAIPTTPL
jgi:hypothetical protein